MRSIVIVVAIFLTTIASGILYSDSQGFEGNGSIIVDINGTEDYISIQDAINNSTSGATIIVRPGVYRDNLIIENKSLSIIGTDRNKSIIDGQYKDTVVTIIGHGSVKISNLTIIHSDLENGSGIYIQSATDTTISNLIIQECFAGIYCNASSEIGIDNNSITGCKFGIQSFRSSHLDIKNNDIHQGEKWKPALRDEWFPEYLIAERIIFGITMVYTSDSTISSNIISEFKSESDHYYNIAIPLGDCHQIMIEKNIFCDNDIGIRITDSHQILVVNNQLSDNGKGLFCDYSSSLEIIGNMLYDCDGGFILTKTDQVRITNNNISNGNYSGIAIFLGENTTIIENLIDNVDRGVYLDGNSNTMSRNDVKNNDIGIVIRSDCNVIFNNNISQNREIGIEIWHGTAENVIFGNCFINNSVQANDSYNGDNYWNNSDGEGNYWSDYFKENVDSDFTKYVWTVPYEINKSDQWNPSLDNRNVTYDYFPLMNPWYDRDGDGVDNHDDIFPFNMNEWNDTDIDGTGDNSDAFPEDPSASIDTDFDGSPDAWNPNMTESDSTNGLYIDAFPTDPSASIDTDGDGLPDSWNPGKDQSDSTTGLHLDDFPADPSASIDKDGDGMPDKWNDGMDQNDSTSDPPLVIDLYPDDPDNEATDDDDSTNDDTDENGTSSDGSKTWIWASGIVAVVIVVAAVVVFLFQKKKEPPEEEDDHGRVEAKPKEERNK